VVKLVLNDLRCPAGEGPDPELKFFILPPDLHTPVTAAPPGAAKQRKAPLLRFIGIRRFDDLRVEHHHVFSLVIKGDDPLVDPDHVGRHAHAAVFVGLQRL